MALNTVIQGKLEYLTAENICVPHCFTTRRGGVSSGIFDSLNIALHGGDSEENVAKNLEILSKAIGFDLNKLVLTRQIHSDIVRVVTDADHIGIDHHAYPNCDALVTNTPGTALMVYTADCTPILLHDPMTGAVGAAHAGWRGTAANIAGKTVQVKCNGGAQRFPQNGWKSFAECNGRRELNCETYKSSRCESRA